MRKDIEVLDKIVHMLSTGNLAGVGEYIETLDCDTCRSLLTAIVYGNHHSSTWGWQDVAGQILDG